MLIKSCRRKEPSFEQLLRYLAAESKNAGQFLLRNFPAAAEPAALDDLIAAFAANARHLPARRNGNALYQEILSFHPDDAAAVAPDMLRDLAARYLELRAPGALACAVAHHDRAHPHVHLVIAANLPGRQKKLRLSRQEFAAAQRELEAYRKERYPQLRRSLVTPRSEQPPDGRELPEPPPVTLPEDARARRLQRQDKPAPSDKELLRDELLQALTRASGREAFRALLAAAGFAVYERGGRPYGVIRDGRKYRFRTLGLAAPLATAEAQWRRLPARLRALAGDRLGRFRSFVRGFGYAEEVLAVLEQPPADPREQLLKQDRWQRRRRRREGRSRDSGRAD